MNNNELREAILALARIVESIPLDPALPQTQLVYGNLEALIKILEECADAERLP